MVTGGAVMLGPGDGPVGHRPRRRRVAAVTVSTPSPTDVGDPHLLLRSARDAAAATEPVFTASRRQVARRGSGPSASRRDATLALVVAVGLGEAALLDALRDLVMSARLVALVLHEGVEEGVRRMTGRGSPPRCPSPGSGAAGRGPRSRGRRSAGCGSSSPGNAVVSAIVAARGGISRFINSAEMRAALPVCSGSKVSVMPGADRALRVDDALDQEARAEAAARRRRGRRGRAAMTAPSTASATRTRGGSESARSGAGRVFGMGGPRWAPVGSWQGRWRRSGSVVGVQGRVEGDAGAGTVAGLDGTADAVADEEDVARPRQLPRP